MWVTNQIPLFFKVAGLIYYPSLRIGQSVMKNKEPYKIKKILFCWNFFMAFMSALGAFYTVPFLLKAVYNWEGNRVYCDNQTIINNRTIYPIILVFAWTKIFEWVDTLFLVLRKRKIIFLHWFHHLLTFCYSLHSMMNLNTMMTACWFTSMNLAVHAIMYSYYACTSIGIKFTKASTLITVLQTSQMFVGVYVSIKALSCKDVNYTSTALSTIMYSIYVYLFTKLLIRKIKHTATQLLQNKSKIT